MSIKLELAFWSEEMAIIWLISFYIAGIFLTGFHFSENTLQWFTSTIAQAFGALVAIMVAIGLHSRVKLVDIVKDMKKSESTNDPIELFIKKQGEIWGRLYRPIQSMVALIAVSLFVMMLINSSYIWNDFSLALIFVFLFLYSLYTLELLVLRISKTFCY